MKNRVHTLAFFAITKFDQRTAGTGTVRVLPTFPASTCTGTYGRLEMKSNFVYFFFLPFFNYGT